MEEFLNAWKRHFTFAALLSCFVNLLQLTFPFYMFTIYQNVVLSHSRYSLEAISAAALFALSFYGIFYYVRARLLACAGSRLHEIMRSRIFAGMVEKDTVSGTHAYKQGMADLTLLRDYFYGKAIYSLFDAPWAPFYLILIFFIHPMLGCIACGGGLVVVALSVLQEYLIRDSMTQANQWNQRNQRFVSAFLRNTEVINGMGMADTVADWFDRSNEKVIFNQTQSSRYAGMVQSALKPMQNVIQVVIYCVGAYFVMTQGFSVGLMVASSIIMGRGVGPLTQAAAYWKMTVRVRDAYKRLKLFEVVLDAKTEKMPLPAPKGLFQLEGATYTVGGRALVANVSFNLDPGQFLGIIGPSGAGKTSLCRVMLGIWPCTAGRSLLDGTDAFLWDKEAAGRKIGYLPQEIELFPASLAENIARLGPVDMAAVEAAATLSGLVPLVEKLPDGYDTFMEGPGGIRLSGGQKQLVGIAMALYGDPNILVLDEPTSNLDEATEGQVLVALARLKQQGKTTCIMVTHKPALLHSMDRILVLRQGQVAEMGSKDDIFSRQSGLASRKLAENRGAV